MSILQLLLGLLGNAAYRQISPMDVLLDIKGGIRIFSQSTWAWWEVVAAHYRIHDYACCHLQADCLESWISSGPLCSPMIMGTFIFYLKYRVDQKPNQTVFRRFRLLYTVA